MRSLIYIGRRSKYADSVCGKNKSTEKIDKPGIILASFPRSGNTFLRNILLDVFGVYSWNNINVYNKGLKEFRKLEKLNALNAITAPGERKLNKLKEQFAFAAIKTHEVPKNILPICNPDAKIIYLLRDGRDALVSMAHHRKDIIEPGSDFLKNLKEALWAPMGSYFGGWGANVEQWTEIADLVIYFEDLVNDPEKEIRRLQEVLDLPEPKMDRIPTFDSQRNGGSHFGGKKRKRLSKEEQDDFNQRFFRSGQSGGWKQDMPEEIQEKFWKKYGSVMTKMGYSRDGSFKKDTDD
ncbi:MAG: sulfotransferase domain-containing protein [Bacteroidales bacterium]|nr:sulfotransferase domain-containing protein [Bacteroidales bacterium]